ncbi:thiol reductant ABC exporter subunit CydD [Streptomyces sp. NPDC092296]|uniref:thiol reductant ABC exporter subunit CydD n=1 Tax=Streptomyces sp. NPDC092296 TaxID=3366012 RepID=UPI0038054C8D
MKPVDPRLLAHARATRTFLACSVLLGAAGAGLVIAQAGLIAEIVVRAFQQHAGLTELRTPLLLLAAVALGRAAVAWLTELAAHRACATVKSELRRKLLDHATRLDPAARSGRRTGELTALATRGVDALDDYFARYLPQLALAVVVPALVLLRILGADWLSAALIAATLPLIPLFMVLIGLATQSRMDRQWQTLARLSHHFLDIVAGLPTLKVFGRAKAQARAIAAVTDDYRRATMRTLRIAFISSFALELLSTLSVALVAVSIGFRLVDGSLDLGTGLLVLVLAPEAYLPIRQVGTHYHASVDGLAAADRVFAVLETPLPPAGRTPAPDLAGATLTATGLTVTHPGRTTPALHDAELRIGPGETVAVTGPSGAGKSTLLSVLLGFTRPDAGTVRVTAADGTVYDLADLDPDDWRRRIAWVPQHPHLYAGSIADNVRLARPDATDTEVRAALRAAHALDFTDRLPDGVRTPLGEGGAGLSAGQRQRLALARAFLAADRPLVLLDEPTANLDGESEAAVVAAVDALAADPHRTVLLVAHRPALLATATHHLHLTTPPPAPPSGVRAAALASPSGARGTARPAPHDPNEPTLPAPSGARGTARPAPHDPNEPTLPAPSGARGTARPAPYDLDEPTLPAPSGARGTARPAPHDLDEPTLPAPSGARGTARPAPHDLDEPTLPAPANSTPTQATRPAGTPTAGTPTAGTPTAGTPTAGTPLSRIVRLARATTPRARFPLAALLGSLALGSAVALLATSGWLISRASQQPPVLYLMVAVTSVRAFGIGRSVFRYAERLLSHDTVLRALGGLRTAVHARLERLAPAALHSADGFRRGDLLSRLVADVDAIQDWFLRWRLPVAAAVTVSAAASLGLAALLPAAGAVLAAGLLLAGVAVPALSGALARRTERRTAPARGALATGVLDVLTGTAELTAAGALPRRLAVVRDADAELTRLAARSAATAGLGSGLTALITGLTVAGAAAVGVQGVAAGTLSGVCLAVLVLTPLAAFEAVAGMPVAAQFRQRSTAAAARLVEVLDTPDPVREPDQPAALPATPLPVTVRGLHARWPGQQTDALAGLDLDLTAGRRTAVVGPSGSGKSTLAAALLRFLEPTAGSITLGSGPTAVDSRAASGDDVRRVIGLCAQDAHLFDSSLRENLRLARPTATEADLRRALAAARLLTWVDSLPDGLDTMVGEHGARLSGGQRQRLALARALLADFPVLILDEPAEHLDLPTADALTADLLDATTGRTTLLITHRLAGLADAGVDEVLVLDRGRVVQRGGWDELVGQDGPLRTMWRREQRADLLTAAAVR